MPLAVGTSLAIIIPTSVRSWRGHRARGAVDDALLKVWALPIVLGVLVGAVVARVAPAEVFQAVFIGVACVNAIKLVSGTKRWNLATDLPTGIGLRVYGWIIGLLSSLMGIGGGQITNMIMTLHGRPIHQAVATSAGVGILISVPGRDRLRTGGMGTARSSRGRDRLRFASRSRVVRADNDPDRRSRGSHRAWAFRAHARACVRGFPLHRVPAVPLRSPERMRRETRGATRSGPFMHGRLLFPQDHLSCGNGKPAR